MKCKVTKIKQMSQTDHKGVTTSLENMTSQMFKKESRKQQKNFKNGLCKLPNKYFHTLREFRWNNSFTK